MIIKEHSWILKGRGGIWGLIPTPTPVTSLIFSFPIDEMTMVMLTSLFDLLMRILQQSGHEKRMTFLVTRSCATYWHNLFKNSTVCKTQSQNLSCSLAGLTWGLDPDYSTFAFSLDLSIHDVYVQCQIMQISSSFKRLVVQNWKWHYLYFVSQIKRFRLLDENKSPLK